MSEHSALKALIGSAAVLTGANAPALADEVLPKEPAPFAGKIDPDRNKSVPSWTKPVKAPKGAPNVIVILLDDVGFGASSVTGGPVNVPVLQQLAQSGLRYNNFHVNALCSPTRAALLSGRNDHEIGFGSVTEGAAGYPGYSMTWPRNAASIAEVLKDNGYSTAAFGKWHNTPTWEISPVGPFEHWPTGLGFEYFYGFLGGEDSQWHPRLYRNTTPVEPGKSTAQGYHLTADLADEAIRWLHQHDAVAPDKPFFLYFATGATHTPHHVAPQWIAKYKGKFDQGWDKLREETFQRQKAAGIIPANAQLTPRPKELPAWDSLSPEQKKLLSRQAEVYAAFLEQTDHEVGRVLKAVQEEGQSDNTLVLYIVGDNGASAEGGLEGDDAHHVDGKPATTAERANVADKLGSDEYFNHYAAGWAWGLDTPFQWTKQVASHLGGTTDPLIVSWPARIKDRGATRGQFHHVTDIAPTIYEATGIKVPDVVNGVKQLPLEGSSLAYSFDAPSAPSNHSVQYFEMLGNLGIYKDGWWAGKRNLLPWELLSINKSAASDHPWELYNLTEDYSQAHDLAATHPEKLKELTDLFDSEAKRNNVYPVTPGFGLTPTAAGYRNHFVFRSGVERIPPQTFGYLKRRSHSITADVVIPAGKANGVIIAEGGKEGGFSLYLKDGLPVFEVNVYGNTAAKVAGTAPLKPGKAHIVVDVAFDPAPAGQDLISAYLGVATGKVSLTVNGEHVGETKLANYAAVYAESLDVGKDLGSAVSRSYQAPFAFNGTIDTVALDLK